MDEETAPVAAPETEPSAPEPKPIARRILLWSAAVVVMLLVAVAGLYVADTPVEAEIQDARCNTGEVDLLTVWPLPGIEHTLGDLDSVICQLFLEPGSYAVYHVRSERTLLYEDASKECLKYDSEGDRIALFSACLQ